MRTAKPVAGPKRNARSKVSVGKNDLFDSGGINLLSETVNNLPTDGSTLYVTLYSLIGSTWQFNVYTYQAFH